MGGPDYSRQLDDLGASLRLMRTTLSFFDGDLRDEIDAELKDINAAKLITDPGQMASKLDWLIQGRNIIRAKVTKEIQSDIAFAEGDLSTALNLSLAAGGLGIAVVSRQIMQGAIQTVRTAGPVAIVPLGAMLLVGGKVILIVTAAAAVGALIGGAMYYRADYSAQDQPVNWREYAVTTGKVTTGAALSAVPFATPWSQFGWKTALGSSATFASVSFAGKELLKYRTTPKISTEEPDIDPNISLAPHERFAMILKYINTPDFVKKQLPELYKSFSTHEATAVVTYLLLNAISLSNDIGAETKREYLDLIFGEGGELEKFAERYWQYHTQMAATDYEVTLEVDNVELIGFEPTEIDKFKIRLQTEKVLALNLFDVAIEALEPSQDRRVVDFMQRNKTLFDEGFVADPIIRIRELNAQIADKTGSSEKRLSYNIKTAMDSMRADFAYKNPTIDERYWDVWRHPFSSPPAQAGFFLSLGPFFKNAKGLIVIPATVAGLSIDSYYGARAAASKPTHLDFSFYGKGIIGARTTPTTEELK